MRLLGTLCVVLLPLAVIGQMITGPNLLDKTIKYHDPKGKWSELSATFKIDQTRPDGSNRTTEFSLKNAESHFALSEVRDGHTIVKVVAHDDCTISFDGASEFSDEVSEKYRLSCEQVKRVRNYYTYLYGLPMKLRDPGTHISDEVTTESFNGKDYLKMTVTYDADVGLDTWFFYIDPDTYAMEGYGFTHENGKGEYITLDGELTIRKIRIPKSRTWYVIEDDRLLGTDELVEIR